MVKEDGLRDALQKLAVKPRMVITDSQAFSQVDRDTPGDIPLTSFSILMARYKGFLTDAVKGVVAIDRLQDGDKVLIAEGCTHHRQCEDIGTVKIPRWLREYTGKELQLEHSSGRDFPEDPPPTSWSSTAAAACSMTGRWLTAARPRPTPECPLPTTASPSPT